MRNNPILGIIIFSLVILVIDAYCWWGITKIISGFRVLTKKIIAVLFWMVPFINLTGFAILMLFRDHIPADRSTAYIHIVSGSFFVFYLPKLIFTAFNIVDDIVFLIRKKINFIQRRIIKTAAGSKRITRRKLLTQVGIVFAGLPLIPMIYGIKVGRFDFTTRHVRLPSANLPAGFNGLKIVQISDFHIGTFFNHADQVLEVVNIVNDEKPDLLLFTGDFVNNYAAEMDPFLDILAGFKAHIGKYSILGNHDYGEYVRWKSQEDKQANLDRLMRLQRASGFDLLMDESRKIQIQGEEIELVGIQNWGLPPFPQYGDLGKALNDVSGDSFKILMSHDPTHWDAQVREKTNIDLMLSGHTHGAQFGIEIPGWRWSPVNMRYKQWGGLYTEGRQSLYVNTGLGSIGYPGRVGMPPEITVIELNKA